MGYYEDYLARAGKVAAPATKKTTGAATSDPYQSYLLRAAKAGVQVVKTTPKVATTTPTTPTTPATTTTPATVATPSAQNNFNLPPTTLSAARPKNLIQKIGDWVNKTFGQDPETTKAAAQNAYALKKTYPEQTKDISLASLAEPGGNILKNSPAEQLTKDVGIRDTPTASELTNTVMTISLATAFVEVPLMTLASLGLVTAVNKIKSNMIAGVTGQPLGLGNSQTLSDLAPDANPLVKNSLDLIDFFATATILGLGIKKGLANKKLSNQGEFTPEQVREITTKRGLDKTELGKSFMDAAQEAELTGKNINIKMGAEKTSTIAKTLGVDTPQSLNVTVELVDPVSGKVTPFGGNAKTTSPAAAGIPPVTPKTPPMVVAPPSLSTSGVSIPKVSPKFPTETKVTSPKAPEKTIKSELVQEPVSKEVVKTETTPTKEVTKENIIQGTTKTDEVAPTTENVVPDKKLYKSLGFTKNWEDSFAGYDYALADKNITIKEAQTKQVELSKNYGYDLQANEDGTIKLFHGTDEKGFNNIVKKGFSPEKMFASPSIAEDFGGVNGAGYYGDKIFSFDVDPRDLTFRQNGEYYVNDASKVTNIKEVDKATNVETAIKIKKQPTEMQKAKAEVAKEQRNSYSKGELDNIARIKKQMNLKFFAEGDVETLMKKYPAIMSDLIEAARRIEHSPELSAGDALEVLMNVPSKKSTFPGYHGEFDTGGYSNVESDRNKLENLRGFEFPELLQLYQTLTNSTPIVKAMKSYLGYHRAGIVALSTDLWKSDNPREAVLTFGHEIGHLTDFFPTKTMKRGNILGHIATLRGYLKHFLAEKPGATGEITEKDRVRLRKEAVKQSKKPVMQEEWVTVGSKKATPQEVLDIWNDNMAGEKMPELMDWIKRLSEGDKVQIVKGAIKGVLPEWANFGVEIREKRLREVIKNAPADIKAKYQELLREEVLKRKLFALTEVKKELVDLSQLWKPFDVNADPRYTKYRNSAKELYADALSVLFNDPALLAQKAPVFNQAFFNYIDQKPEFSKAFFEAQTTLLSGHDTVMENRLGSVLKNYKTGNDKLMSIRAEAMNAKNNLVRMLDNAFNDVNSETNRRVAEATKAGVSIPDEINPIFTQSSLNYMDSRVKNFMVDNVQPVVAKVSKVPTVIVETNFAGKKELIPMNGFEAVGFVMQMERSIKERGKFANPGGFAPKEATDTLAHTKTKYNKNDWIKIKNAVRLMRKAVKKLNLLAFQHGYRSAELTTELLANKSYATFQVLDYLDTHITSAIYKQKGTLKGVANPALTTAMKMVSTLRSIYYNDAKVANVAFLKLTDPENITPSRLVWNGRSKIATASKDKNKVMALVVEEGKLVGYDIDKELDYTFNKTDDTKMRQLGKIVKYITQAPVFRNIYITINLGYQMANARRDFQRLWRNYPDKNVGEALTSWFRATKLYIQAVPSAFNAATGRPDAIIKEMENLGILGLTRNDFYGLPDTVGEEYITASLEDLGVLPGLKQARGSAFSKLSTKILNKVAKTPILNIPGMLLNAVETTGNFIERIPKVAGYKGLKASMSEARLAHYVRNYIGSPDFLVQGSATPVTNNLLMFSNAAKEGFKGDYRQAFKQKGTKGAWWFKMIIGTILPKLFQRAAKMGLLGLALKKLYDNISEYDLANYDNYALSFDAGGKTVYIRDPKDETGRFVGALVWKITGLFDKTKEQQLSESLMDVFAIYSTQVPSLAPGLTVTGAIATYLSGGNPYDSFRGRNIIPQTAYDTKEFRYTFPPMLNWVKNQLGASIIMPNYTPKGDLPTLEKIINFPILSNIIGRFVKVSSQGQSEKATQVGENITAIAARKKALIDEEIANAISEKRGVDLAKALGHEVKTAEDVTKSLQILKKFQVEKLSGKDVYLDTLIFAATNEAKSEILQDYKKTLPPEQYGALLIKAKTNGIISDDVLKKMIEAEIKKTTSQGFQLVKPAYAAEVQHVLDENNMIDQSMSTLKKTTDKINLLKEVQKIVKKTQDFIPGTVGDKLISKAFQDKLNSMDKQKAADLKDLADSMLRIKELQPDWYNKHYTSADENKILGFNLAKTPITKGEVKGVAEVQQPSLTTSEVAPIEEIPTKTISDEEIKYRNPKATPAVEANKSNVTIINKYADQYGVPRELATDMAFAESSLDNKRRAEDWGFDGKHKNSKGEIIPYSSASGLFMFTNGTWDEMKRRGVVPQTASYEDKLDPELNAKAAMWAVSHKMLSRWNASKDNWGKHYTEEELKRFYP